MLKLRLENLTILLLIFILCDATIYDCDRTASCGCGHTNVDISSRIIYGEEAIPNSWSMIVSLTYTLLFDDGPHISVCGGTILTDSYILTSANCLEELNGNVSFDNLTISAGIHSRNESFQINRKADKIIMHPNRTSSSNRYGNDIALVHLDEPFDFRTSPLITRACLPPQLNTLEELIEYPPIGTTLVIIGWGRTIHTYDESDTLQQLIVYAMHPNDTECEGLVVDPRTEFCAGRVDGGTGVCFGDLGGPILQWIDHHWEQVGIISMTRGGCELSSSESYTRVTYYHDWIESYISNNNQPNVTTFTPVDSTSYNSNASSTTPFKNNGYNHQHNTLIVGIIYPLIFIIIL